jgi:putative endonuclease
MKFWGYILQSQSTGRYYCGYTSDPARRVSQHNDPAYKLSRTTKVIKGPWEIVWLEECVNRSAAMRLEKAIKKRGAARYLQAQLAESRRWRD